MSLLRDHPLLALQTWPPQFGASEKHNPREMPDSRDITIGMIWMYAQGLYENASTRGDEIETFEKRVLPWLKDLVSASIGQAAYLTHILNSDFRLKGRFKQEIEKIHT